MSSTPSIRFFAQPLVAAALLYGVAVPAWSPDRAESMQGGTTVIEKTFSTTSAVAPVPAAFVRAPSKKAVDTSRVRLVAETFVWGLSNDRADVVWKYATEEEQAGLQTAPSALAAFKEAYPPLAHARQLTYKGMHTEGDVPFVSFYVRDKLGLQWLATFGLDFDDAGDWRVVSLDITGAPGDLI